MSSWLRLGTSSVRTALSASSSAPDRGLDYGQVADVLDAIREKLPVKLSEAKTQPPTPTIPPTVNTTVITAKDMESHHDTTVQQALQRVTGVTVK